MTTTLYEPTPIRALRQEIHWHTWRKEANERALASGLLDKAAQERARQTILDANREIAKVERRLEQFAPGVDV